MRLTATPAINPAAALTVAIQAIPKASGGHSSPVHFPFKYSAYIRPATVPAETNTIAQKVIYILNISITCIYVMEVSRGIISTAAQIIMQKKSEKQSEGME
ncbi:hypothetical protein EKI49_20165 [Escherichia coli]|nr:hypothetical protein [Escherichia coli]EFN8469010.1 hypothetical protein [Escherichia coli]UMS69486.1 hypothetical protein AOY72_23025 [Escherichia coli]